MSFWFMIRAMWGNKVFILLVWPFAQPSALDMATLIDVVHGFTQLMSFMEAMESCMTVRIKVLEEQTLEILQRQRDLEDVQEDAAIDFDDIRGFRLLG
ncbi:Uncharacterized protein TCM_014365 [Theobroma cacao]|uniref:Uncharacterized protein n=1 Tax=Theobroma cacao TaxID=3641 RepID=A0A061FXC2_THECC|nr:Uncharacterized protein TCM_014365 [Theobroma cacao]